MNKNKFYGAFIGLAIGDSLGAAVEFKPRDTFLPVTDMAGGGVFNLPPGYWTDDTSMAICLAENIIANGRVQCKDLLERFCRWYKEGENSSTGKCFDIGLSTISALQNYLYTGSIVNNTRHDRAGNGSIMRLAPVVIKHHSNRDLAFSDAILQSKPTHASQEVLDSCVLLTNILLNAIIATKREQVISIDKDVNLVVTVKNILTRLDVPREQVKSSGYVIDTLHAALWAFMNTNSFKDAILLAVNLGEDADTVGAVTGQIAGMYYGLDNIPNKWVNEIYQKERLIDLVDRLTNE
jgi:ADP-ribosyl-[dinitrogen reductase] hydrolase